MKNIIFRAKTEKGEWIFGGYAKCNNREYILPDIDLVGREWVFKNIEVIHETVGQFTGLTDKNGKKIFEGDILAETWWGKLYEKNPIVCKFHNGSFCFTQYRIWDTANNCKRAWVWKQRFLKKTLKYCEVIGNITDSPELLEVEDER